MVAVDGEKAVMMSSGASEAVVRMVRAAAADANLTFREDALTVKDLVRSNCSAIGVRGLTCAFNLGKVVEYKSRALVNVWQQQGQLQMHQDNFLMALKTHLAAIDRHPMPLHPL
jgi:hypothetical protein